MKPSVPLTVSLAAYQPGQIKVTWTPPEKYALQGILKYVVTCVNTLDPTDTRTVKVLHTKREVIVGSATSGDNRALSLIASYTCNVAAINAIGVGPSTDGNWT